MRKDFVTIYAIAWSWHVNKPSYAGREQADVQALPSDICSYKRASKFVKDPDNGSTVCLRANARSFRGGITFALFPTRVLRPCTN